MAIRVRRLDQDRVDVPEKLVCGNHELTVKLLPMFIKHSCLGTERDRLGLLVCPLDELQKIVSLVVLNGRKVVQRLHSRLVGGIELGLDPLPLVIDLPGEMVADGGAADEGFQAPLE